MNRSKINFFIIFFSIICVFLCLIWLFILDFNSSEDWKNVAIEFHGLVFDIVLFGIILTCFDLWRGKKERIQNLKDQLDDFRRWDEKEASFKNVGIIKRLNNLNAKSLNLQDTFLGEANLSGVDLEGASLRRSNLYKADLSVSNLSGADLGRSNLKASNLIGANLSRADLSEANLSGADLSEANLSGSNFFLADLSGSGLIGANFSKTTLICANLSNVDLLNANFTEANLTDANLCGVNLAEAKSLYGVKGLPSDLLGNLKIDHPHLFERVL